MTTATLHTLQLLSMVVIAALLFASRGATGKARPVPEGIAFPLKPFVVWSRVLAVLFYGAFFAFPLWISQRSIPAWLLLLLFAATMFALYQLPGTILLRDDGVVQRFWLRAPKRIPYRDVQDVQVLLSGRQTRVVAPDRTVITHTYNHVDATGFQAQLEQHLAHRRTE